MHIIVIGAGIVGVSCAYRLQSAGHEVTLIDKGAVGMGCSFGNGGAISPDLCVPIALPGMLKRVPRWFADPLGPLVVRWSHFPSALPWMIKWIKEGRDIQKVQANSNALRALHRHALADYREMLGADYAEHIEETGQIYVWQNDRSGPVEILAKTLRERHGVKAERLNAADIQRIDPHLNPIYKNGLHFPENGHTLNPLRLVETLAEKFRMHGGRILNDELVSFSTVNGVARSAKFAKGSYDAQAFVLATGIDGARMAGQLGDAVSIQAERGYHVMLPKPEIRPAIKISNRDHMFGLTPMRDGVRISGTVEIAAATAPPNYKRAEALLTRAKEMYPSLNTEGATFWMGSRPSTPDSLPIIDRATRARNVIYAFGHGHSGLTGAPMTARLVRTLIEDTPPPIDLAPFRHSRF